MNYSTLSYDDLIATKESLLGDKRKLAREIDVIDTEIIGIKEELRKRQEKGLLVQNFQNAFTKG